MSEREKIVLTAKGEKVKKAVRTLLATAAIAAPGGAIVNHEISQGADQGNIPGQVEKTITTSTGEHSPIEKSGGEAQAFFHDIESNNSSGRILEGQWWFGDVNDNGDKVVVNNPIIKATNLDESSVTVGAVYASEGLKTFTFDKDHFSAQIKSEGEFHGVQDFTQLEQVFDATQSDIMSFSFTDLDSGWPSVIATVTQESDLGSDAPAASEQVYLGTMGTELNVGDPAIG